MSARSADVRDIAVVDVGSNSVRLVTYRLEGRAIWTVYNEKVLAGLGREIAVTGKLDPKGVETAISALRRFRAVINGVQPDRVHVAATAAVRDAEDGPDFVARIRDEAGLVVRVLSGREEAQFSALGVVAGHPKARGVVGDLGGASLELIRVDQDAPGDGVTLPLGPFSLGAPGEVDAAAVRKRALAALETASRFKTDEFHAVGGAWRSLALIHMAMTNYPLKIVHQYEINAAEALDVARFTAKQSRGSLEKIQGLSKKRADILPWAALVLEAVIETLGLERIVFSAYGLREGLLYDGMSDDLKAHDPLIEGCAALGRRQGVIPELGEALAQWLAPAFADLEPVFGLRRDAVLMQAACRLADIGARLHPEHRADLAFIQVLHAPIAGQGHAQRAFLATAIHARYGSSALEMPEEDTVRRLLDHEAIHRAKVLGLAIRLGADFAGRAPAPLRHSTLELGQDKMVLTASRKDADILLGEQTAKRANALANALGIELELRAK